jgi:hypothetical protein
MIKEFSALTKQDTKSEGPVNPLLQNNVTTNEQERQCAYNVISRHVRATVVAIEKSINITYSECVFVALGIQHEMDMQYVVICGLSDSTLFFRVISQTQESR